MFELPYNYKCVNKQIIEKRNFRYEEIKHTFNCRFNQQYIVNVERYDNEIYIIKFHLKNHSNSDNKYSILSGLHDMPRILATCIKIMLDIYDKNPYASFGFIGANSLGETQNNTKRFFGSAMY